MFVVNSHSSEHAANIIQCQHKDMLRATERNDWTVIIAEQPEQSYSMRRPKTWWPGVGRAMLGLPWHGNSFTLFRKRPQKRRHILHVRNTKDFYTRSGVLTVMVLKSLVFVVIIPHWLVNSCLALLDTVDDGNKIVRNICNYLAVGTP